MANFLGLLPPPATAVLKALQHDPTAGAVEDLRYTSPALRSLNDAPNTKGVAVHALGTHLTLNPLLPLQALLNGQFSYGGFLAGWAALTYPTAAADVNHFLTTDVFRSRHDLVVGVNSQCGGLDSAASAPVTTLFGGQWHGSGGTPAVQRRMAELLRANTRSAAFATGGFHPLPITSIFPRVAVPAGPVAGTSTPRTMTVLRILAPTRTTVLRDADSLRVQVDADVAITKVLLVCGAGTPQLYTRLLDAGARTGYIRVPRGVVGRLQVAAFGFADSVYQQFDTLSVAVNTAASLTGLRVTPAETVVPLADSVRLQVIATYADGLERTVVGSGLTFALTGSRARITRTGWLVGIAAGVDSLRVTYGGRTAAARVKIVRPALGAPLPVQLTHFTAVRQGADAHLQWTTATEQASAYFVIESSVDGRVFRFLHQLPARGTTTQRSEYSFTDTQIGRYGAGQVYYRLHQVDQDGHSNYSGIQVVIGSALAHGLQAVVHPNPVHGSATCADNWYRTGDHRRCSGSDVVATRTGITKRLDHANASCTATGLMDTTHSATGKASSAPSVIRVSHVI